jgi:hypothetical protein
MRGRVKWIRGYGHEFRLAYKMEFINAGAMPGERCACV